MSNRVGKRRRRVAAAEAALTTHRLLLREEVRALVADARVAATPGRIVAGGFALGALAGLATGRRSSAGKAPAAPAAKPGLLQSLTGAVRLVSMAMPMLTSLMAMVQGAAAAQSADPAASEPGSAGVAPGDPLP